MEGTQVTDIEKKVDYPQFKRGINIGKQLNERSNTHTETVYVLYDKYGAIGEYKTHKDAEKELKSWYIDPELYPDGKAGLHIEEETHEISNKIIHVKDDLI